MILIDNRAGSSFMQPDRWYKLALSDRDVYFYATRAQKNGGMAGFTFDVDPTRPRKTPKPKHYSVDRVSASRVNQPYAGVSWQEIPASEVPEAIELPPGAWGGLANRASPSRSRRDAVQVVLAWAERSAEVERERRTDLGERPILRQVIVGKAAMWLNRGTQADVQKAQAYAEQGNAKPEYEDGRYAPRGEMLQRLHVFTYPTTEKDPLGRARREAVKLATGGGANRAGGQSPEWDAAFARYLDFVRAHTGFGRKSDYAIGAERGKKYARVFWVDPGSGSRNVHTFVDLATGEVRRADSWKKAGRPVGSIFAWPDDRLNAANR